MPRDFTEWRQSFTEQVLIGASLVSLYILLKRPARSTIYLISAKLCVHAVKFCTTNPKNPRGLPLIFGDIEKGLNSLICTKSFAF